MEQRPTFIEDLIPGDPSVHPYDAVPRDGPAIFIARPDTLSGADPLRGRWVDLRLGESALRAELAGHPSVHGWAVIDQTGLGPVTVPEHPTPGELRELIAHVDREAHR